MAALQQSMPQLFDHAVFLQQLVNRVKVIEDDLQQLKQGKADIAHLEPLQVLMVQVQDLQQGKADVAHVAELSKSLIGKATTTQLQELRDDAHSTFEKLQELQRIKVDTTIVQKLTSMVQDKASVENLKEVSELLQSKADNTQINQLAEAVNSKASIQQVQTKVDEILNSMQDRVTSQQLMELEEFAVQQLEDLTRSLEKKVSLEHVTELQEDLGVQQLEELTHLLEKKLL